MNRDHGAWKCHRCGATGSFAELQRVHGDEPEQVAKETAEQWRVFHHALQVCQDTILDYPHVLKYLRVERGLSPDTIGKYQIGYQDETFFAQMKTRGFTLADLRAAGLVAEGSNNLLFAHRIIVPYFSRESIVTLRGKKIGQGWLQARGVSLGLFGSDNIRAQEQDVYVCEGEFDAMLLDQMGYPACGIPGADTFNEGWASWFESTRRVFVLLDADEAGVKGAEKIKKILGAKTRIVELPVPEEHDSTDTTEYFLRDGHNLDDFEKLIEQHRGKRLFTIGEAMVERDLLLGEMGIALGWKDFDHWIHPGLLPGQVMVVLAKTGVGKTAWLTQVLHNLSEYHRYQGGHEPEGPALPVLVLSLEQTKGEMVERLQRIARLWDPWLPDDLFKRAYRNVRLNDENRIPPEDIRPLFNEFIEDVQMQPKLLVLDYLGYWARSFKGSSRYEQVSDAIMELKAIAKELGVAIIVPHQVSRVGKRGERLELDFARDSGVIEETADFALSLWAPHSNEEREDKELGILERADVRLEILKSRHGGVKRETRMLWAPASLALPPSGDAYLKRLIIKEYEWLDEGLLYPDVLRKHKGGHLA